MRTFDIDLKKYYKTKGGTLTAILSDSPYDSAELSEKWIRPAVVVVPGGAYYMVSRREGEPVAQSFLSRGFQTFILNYLVCTDGVSYPEQLIELASAVDYIKKYASEMKVNSDEVFVVGFSAGGHLVGNLATDWQNIESVAGKKLDCKPTATGLCYPVVSIDAGHVCSFDNLLCNYTAEEREKVLKKLNLNYSLSENTPPSFLWTTAEDSVVPSENTLLYALELAKRKIPYEIHVYPECNHGASVGNYEINNEFTPLRRLSRWVDDCAYFFRLFTKEKF